LLHALTGVVLIRTRYGRWMVPPDHAMWIPAGIEHAVDMLGDVSMRSVYVKPDAIDGLPAGLRVVGVGDLMRSLIVEAVALPDEEPRFPACRNDRWACRSRPTRAWRRSAAGSWRSPRRTQPSTTGRARPG